MQNSLPHVVVAKHAARQPDAIAVQFNEEQLTYQQLHQQVAVLVQLFAEQGCSAGQRVAVLLPPSLQQPAVMLAIFSLAGVYFPLDREFPAERIASLVSRAEPTFVVCEESTRGQVPAGSKALVLGELKQELTGGTGQEPRDLPIVCADDPAYLFFTSGTTGEPKGVLGSYANLAFYLSSAVERFKMDAATVMAAVAKFTFSISFFELLCPLVAGGTLRVLPRSVALDPAAMAHELTRINMIHCGPTLMRRIVEPLLGAVAEGQAWPQGQHLKHVSMGGDLVPTDLLCGLLRLFPGAEVFVVYGCTEIACMGTAHRYYPDRPPTKTFVGTPFETVDLAVVDDELRPVLPGEKGEVCFGGPGVTLGYLNSPDLTDEKFLSVPGGRYYRTGDVGVCTEYGELRLLGRKDFQVKINGVRVELAEVDAQLRRMPLLAGVVTMSQSTEAGDKVIYAYLERDLTIERLAQVRQFLAQNIPSVMHPRAFVRVDTMPVNVNLKIDRNALPLPARDNLMLESNITPPQTQLQQQLLSICQSVLGLPVMGVDDNFFQLGVTSLASIDIARRIESELGVALPMNEFLLAPSVRALAERMQAKGQPEQGLVSLRQVAAGNQAEQQCGKARPLIVVHDGNGDLIPYYTLVKHLPDFINVYGVAPKSVGKVAISHLTIDELTDYYCELLESADTSNGVYLAGLCIGGFLAYCLAAKLQSRGVAVHNVFLFDSHYIDAKPLPYTTTASLNQLTQQMVQLAPVVRYSYLFSKVVSYSRYRIRRVWEAADRQFRLVSLKLGRRLNRLPQWRVATPDVDTVLRYAERQLRESEQRPLYAGAVTLFKATTKRDDLDALTDLAIDDTPYQYFFAGECLGWEKAQGGVQLTKIDVAAGHSTLLMEAYVEPIASEIARCMFRQ
ncbi:AMP-binding protein [Halioxenophilus aromaticivorans]|uniref:Carrier domain-containing protein n=1 Tax=Halioxenophilus aromaticivorans TaxID=1306992 RepID=A0AAV3U8A0_9ALTE